MSVVERQVGAAIARRELVAVMRTERMRDKVPANGSHLRADLDDIVL